VNSIERVFTLIQERLGSTSCHTEGSHRHPWPHGWLVLLRPNGHFCTVGRWCEEYSYGIL
jgi:hypothetical protein